jgi:hypothetical protein
MDISGTNTMQGNTDGLAYVGAAICLLLALWLSMNNGVSYAASLAQAKAFYQYIVLHLSLLIPNGRPLPERRKK